MRAILPTDRHGLRRQGPASWGGMRRPPPHVYFVVSAIFHYLGPAFAVLLFARVEVLGVAWLRIASAALVFALWRRPWRGLPPPKPPARGPLPAPGAGPALMKCCFFPPPPPRPPRPPPPRGVP